MNLKLMKLLAGLSKRDRNESRKRRVNISPALLLILTIVTILLSALSGNAVFTVTVLAVLFVRTALLPAEDIREILAPLLLPVIMTVAIMLPAVFMGSPATLLTVTMKVLASLLSLSLLNHDAGWKGISSALSGLHMPDTFIFILDTTMRFLTILGNFSNSIIEAVSLRRVGKKNWKNAGTGGILGTTFLKSEQLAEEMSEAMTCRGFTGKYRTYEHHRFSIQDALVLTIMACLIVFFIYTEMAIK